MPETETIEHEGIVIHNNGSAIRVAILNQSACAGCHARGACSASDLQEKEVEVRQALPHLQPGAKVILCGQKNLGHRAVLWAYVYPLVLVLAAMFLIFNLTRHEIYAGLGALGMLVPYYGLLALLKNRMTKTFTFHIQTN